jgi:hypothetical protein
MIIGYMILLLYSEMENYTTLRDFIWTEVIHKMWVSVKSLQMPEIF